VNPAARLLLLAKEPVAGRVKTRLTPPFSPGEAARLALAALEDTMDAITAAATSLATEGLAVETVVVLDGRPWRPLDGFRVQPQVAGPLDVRLAAAFDPRPARAPYRPPAVPTVLVGMDTPQVSPEVLASAVFSVVGPTGPDACIGLATDGGWWLLGLRRPDGDLLRGVPMSVPVTGRETCRRLLQAGLDVEHLPVLTDVDTAEDAAVVVEQTAASSRFAVTYDDLGRLAS
jgi:glycosyltransferase A (GT-A) superfamily protein (DUF2064 family)